MMDQGAPISVVSFTHLGYDRDQISEVSYRSVAGLADAGLLRTLYVLDVESDAKVDSSLLSVPIPGGKTIPRGLYLFENLSPVKLFEARKSISMLMDRLVARDIGGGQIVHVFPEFHHTARRAKNEELSTVVYARGCHPDETLEIYEAEQERFTSTIDIPYDWFNRYRRTYEHADYVFYLCDYVKETFLERGFPEDRLFKVGPLTVDTEEYCPGETASDEFVVLGVSDMVPLKGTRYLIDAWEMLDIDDARLVLCGGMSDGVRAELGPRIDRMDSVEHLGYVDNVAEQYRQASVFVHPSLTEGFGKVYAEAMATELPVIATENGPVEFIDDAGLTVPIRDPQAIAEQIRYLYDNPEEARQMGRRGREIAQENTWEEFSERVRDSHRSVLDRLE